MIYVSDTSRTQFKLEIVFKVDYDWNHISRIFDFNTTTMDTPDFNKDSQVYWLLFSIFEFVIDNREYF